jgi:hypothetical protein
MNPVIILTALWIVQAAAIMATLKARTRKPNPFQVEPRGHWTKGTSGLARNADATSRLTRGVATNVQRNASTTETTRIFRP